MLIQNVSQLAQRHEQQEDPCSASARRLLSDPAFPVPATPAEPCLPGPPLACQDVKEDSFLADWWSKVLLSSAPASPNTRTSADRQSLQSRLQRRHSLSGRSLFDLEAIHLQIVQVIQSDATNCLELPRYTGKAQKREVKALGALYGLQPRNCGRKGITLFKTDKAGFPDQNSSGKVTALLANSEATQRHSHASSVSEPTRRKALASKKRKKAKKAHRQASKGDAHQRQDSGAAHLGPVDAAPLDSTNIGSRMLVSMGWQAGTGLGSSLQGQIEPVPVIKRRKHLGLGA